MSREDDLWCDWCGKRNLQIYRYDNRAFCGVSCIQEFPHRSTSDAPALLIRVAVGLDEWAEHDRGRTETPPHSNQPGQNL